MAGVGQEILFALDNFQKPKLLSIEETVAQQIINLLLMRPGNLPGLPHVGVNIEQYLYKTQDQLDAEEIKQKIHSQCSELMSYISLGEVQIFVTTYEGKDLLIVAIPLSGLDQDQTLILGFSSTQNEISVAYQFEEVKNLT